MKTAQEWARDLLRSDMTPDEIIEQAMAQAREQALAEAEKECDAFQQHSHTIESWDTTTLLWERIRALKAKR